MIFSTPLVYCYQKTELEAILMSQPIVPLKTGSLSTVVGRCQLTSREDQLGLLFFDV